MTHSIWGREELKEAIGNKICMDCVHLTFYDWYLCENGLHCDRSRLWISERPLKKCEKFEKKSEGEA